MHPRPPVSLLLIGLFTLSALTLGCASKPAVRADQDPSGPKAEDSFTTPPAATEEEDDGEDDGESALELPPLYFALDSSLLLPQSQQTLQQVAERLRKRRAVKVHIEGHSCELGTTEYNLALGLKRAEATRSYLAQLGVERERIEVVSFGEERPVEEGAGEAVWSKNRRSELKLSRLADSGQR